MEMVAGRVFVFENQQVPYFLLSKNNKMLTKLA